MKISIIICSRKKEIDSALKENLEITVGCDHEIIVVQNEASIFKAYNEGLKKSTSDYICFLHDDIIIHTKNWGGSLIKLFEDHPKYQLLGVAGSKVKTRVPSGWWNCDDGDKILNLIQHFPEDEPELVKMGFKDSDLEEAAMLDGVFLFYKRDSQFWFDERLAGFHGYDLNLCFEILARNMKIGVTSSVLIEHFSHGKPDRDWLASVATIHHMYRSYLPINITSHKLDELEKRNCELLLEKSLKWNMKELFWSYWFKYLILDPRPGVHVNLFKQLLTRSHVG